MKSKGFVLVFLFIFALLLLVGCATQSATVPGAVLNQPATVERATSKAGWEAEWEQVQKEARKEGKVVLYTTIGSDIRTAISEAMRKYGIEVEAMSGRGSELSEKILRERKAGIYSIDMYISGVTTVISQLKPEGVLSPLEPLLILPDVKDTKNWYRGDLPWVDKDKTILAYAAYPNGDFHINSDIIKPGELNSMKDLLSPRWEGKIIMDDPTIAGRGNNVVAAYTIRLGEDFIKGLIKQKPVITRDRRQLIDWVAKGRTPIGIGVYPDAFAEYKRANAPIRSILFKEAAFLDSGAGFVTHFDKSPHTNTSKVLLNWLLSKEGQLLWSKLADAQSARLDVPIDHLIAADFNLRQDGVDYLQAAKEEWVLVQKPQSEKIFLDAFRALLK